MVSFHGTGKLSSFLRWNCTSKKGIPVAFVFFVLLVFALSIFHLVASTAIQWPRFVCGRDANERTAEILHSSPIDVDEDAIKITVHKLKKKIHKLEEKIAQSVTFLPLIDKRKESEPLEGTTWFMSSFRQEFEDPDGLLNFPSNSSKERILCVSGRNNTDGTRNGYGLARRDHLPADFIFLPGLTFVAEEYYTLQNIWHSLDALGPFLLWSNRHQSAKPDRFVLYRKGELTYETSSWVKMVLLSAIGFEVPIERFDHIVGREDGRLHVCFERAVVGRHGLGRFSRETKAETMDIIRQSARRFCNITKAEEEGNPSFYFTLFTRTGARSFKNESAVHSIFGRECAKVAGCRFRNIRTDGLSFCDQVYVMTTTQVLATVHGAQLTNIVFMEPGSHVMEMYPKGWLELAGPGRASTCTDGSATGAGSSTKETGATTTDRTARTRRRVGLNASSSTRIGWSATTKQHSPSGPPWFWARWKKLLNQLRPVNI